MDDTTHVWQVSDPTNRVTDPDAVEPPKETTFAAAQRAVNFVVFEPAWLPADCGVSDVTLRPEQPPGRPAGVEASDVGQTPWSDGNPCAVRAIIEGDGRQLRLKQFLYDWAPPAASVAPLWRTADPEPVPCAASVGWIGTDYKDNRGACIQRARTQIEVSILEGEFGDDELAEILRGLEMVAPDRAHPVRNAPFHRLSYWLRYGCEPPSVPQGLWEYDAVRPFAECYVASPLALRERDVTPFVPKDDRFVLDSIAVYPKADAIEAVFRNRENHSDHLWSIATAADSPLAPSIPPEPSEQPAETRAAID